MNDPLKRPRRSQTRSDERERQFTALLSRARWQPAVASDYIHHFEDLLAANTVYRVVLYNRVSQLAAVRNGSLDEATEAAIEELRQYGFRLGKSLIVFEGWETGRISNINHRPILKQAIRWACRARPVIVVPSRDRFIRRTSFGRGRPLLPEYECPTKVEFERLSLLTHGLTLGSLLLPDMPQTEVRSIQTKRGQAAKGNRGGGDRMPGWKKRLREHWLAIVLSMAAEGRSLREIELETGIDHVTASRWILRHG